MKRRNQAMSVLFLGRGPFSHRLQTILIDECTRISVPEPSILALGKEKGAYWQDYRWDLAFVVTPPQAHDELLPALWKDATELTGKPPTERAPRPIWVEKPFGSSALQAQTLAKQWTLFGCPHTYVDFTHLQDPLVEVLKHRATGTGPRLRSRFDTAKYKPRSYLSPEWDWGAHAHAMGLWLNRTVDHIKLFPKGGTGYVADNHGVQESLYCAWQPDGKGLQRGIREMLALVYGTPAARIEHPNWDLNFAVKVTEQLEASYGQDGP